MATYEMEILKPAKPEFQTLENTSYELQQQILLEIKIDGKVTHSTDLGKSDPYCVVEEVRKGMLGRSVIGRTEKISSSDEVNFRLPIYVPYLFEEDQVILFSIYDYDRVGNNDLIGVNEVLASELIDKKEINLTLRKKQKKTANLTLYIDIIPPLPPQSYTLTYKAFLPKKQNTYLVIEKVRSDRTRIEVYKSGKQKHKSAPVWEIKDLERKRLHTNEDCKLEFLVYSTSTFGENKLCGRTSVTFDDICNSVSDGKQQEYQGSLILKEEGKSNTENGSQSSTEEKIVCPVEIESRVGESATKEYGKFLGTKQIQLKIHVAIDFTASNGPSRDPDSLHTVTGSGNQYVEVLTGSLPGLLKYADNNITAYGFGAKLKGSGETSHCFPLNDNELNPDVLGLEDLLKTYKNTLEDITLSGPTVISKVIKTVALNVKRESEKNPGQKKYNILLILTDGVICDREATIDSIVYASYLPISIVIVGLGGADFTDMRRLDGDLRPLRNGKNQEMIRDIVQFVSMKSIEKNRCVVKKYEKEEEFMNKAINREIPEHIIEYFEKFEKKLETILKKPYSNIEWWNI